MLAAALLCGPSASHSAKRLNWPLEDVHSNLDGAKIFKSVRKASSIYAKSSKIKKKDVEYLFMFTLFTYLLKYFRIYFIEEQLVWKKLSDVHRALNSTPLNKTTTLDCVKRLHGADEDHKAQLQHLL